MKNYKLFDVPILGNRYFKKRILDIENGEMESETIREYFLIRHKLLVGKYSYGCFTNEFNYGDAGRVVIGRYCSFGTNCHYFGANHPYWTFSTSPIFYRDCFGYDVKDVDRYELRIGNDVWFGSGVLVTCACHEIGNGAVIAAGAVVTKSVPPYAVVAGNPARILKYRFNDDTIKLLEKSRWYEMEPDQIMEFYNLANSPDLFASAIIKKYGVHTNE